MWNPNRPHFPASTSKISIDRTRACINLIQAFSYSGNVENNRKGQRSSGSIMLSAAIPSWISIMALRAGGGLQVLGMAGAAACASMVHAAASLVGNPGVRTLVRGRPVTGRVAGRTLASKHACVEGRVCMAA